MVILRNPTGCQTSSPNYLNTLLLDIKSDISIFGHNVVQLVSGDESAYIHGALLTNVSMFLHDILPSSCLCENNVLILPSSPPSTLANLVTLLYAGHISGLSRSQSSHVITIAKSLDLDITSEMVDSEINSIDFIIEQDNNNTDGENQSGDVCKNELKIKAENVSKHGILRLKFPQSRSTRESSNLKINENMSGFQGRIQKEYNAHPVGRYMGPYDQNKKLELKIQLPSSNLDFRKYTEFYHETDECYDLSLKSYESFGDLDKIDSYRVASKNVDVIESDSESDDHENDRKLYTCHLGKCRIPCPCPQCHLDFKQCLEHKIKHEALFDEREHVVSIKSSEEFCLDKSFFHKSYIIKFSGIPLSCRKCNQDLLIHHCYHFEYHDKCRFCKQSWFKHKAKTKEELRSLEKQEHNYFKRVCPFCDKQFIQPNHVKKHIEYEHNGVKFQCSTCEKVFNSKQAKSYHEKIKHSTTKSTIQCQHCKKTFSSEVTLKAHLKFAHSDEKRESCHHCDATFKQIKNLRAHLANIHDIDQMREKYCEPSEKDIFKCEDCDSVFHYKKNLKAHRKSKHEEPAAVYECEICHSKFSYNRKLVSHVKVKHGSLN